MTLGEVKQQAGAAPRKLPSRGWKAKSEPDGAWGLRGEVYGQQKRLLKQGRIVWGALVQANVAVYERGEHDHFAIVVHSMDDERFETPRELRAIAQRLFESKGDPVDRLSHMVADEREPMYARPLAACFTDGASVLATEIAVIRKHLPDEVLHGQVFPLLVLPGETPAVMILPASYWPPSLTRAWTKA